MRRVSTLAPVLAFLLAAPPAAAAEPATHRSQRVVLHTDVPEEKAKTLLEHLEKELDYLAKYWQRPLRGVIECYLVADVANWPEAKLRPGRRAIDAGSGVTLSSTLRSGRGFTTKSTVFASAKGTSLQHEIVHAHCRQTFGEVGPKWYSEGMAEMGQYWSEEETGVNCESSNVAYLRYGQRRVGPRPRGTPTAEPRALEDVLKIKTGSADNYAWSWSLCHLMATNPNYAERFQQFGTNLLLKKRVDFLKVFAKDLERIKFERRLFHRHLERGFRADLCAWDWETPFGPPMSGKTREMDVFAAAGWQATGLQLTRGDRFPYRTTGGWKLAANARAVSPDGGADGRGRLVGVLLQEIRDDATPGAKPSYSLTEAFPLGRQGTLTAPSDGKLYVRCQDDWHGLSDNDGSIRLRLPQSSATPSSKPTAKSKPSTAADAEQRAASKLRLAKLLLKRKPATARQRLREIIDQYPGTKAAEEAAALLGR